MLIWCMGCLVAAAAAAAAGTEPAPSRERGWVLTWMDLELSVDPLAGELLVDGVLTLQLEGPPSPGPDLRLNSRSPLMEFLAVSAAGTEVMLERDPLPAEPARIARLRAPEPFPAGSELEVTFAAGNQGRQGNQFHVGPEVALASWVENWYPVPVPPEGVPLAAASGAPGMTKFNLPAGWRALTCGIRLEQEARADLGTELWEVEIPVARSFCCGPYQVARHEVGGREVEVYRLGEAAEGLAQARGLARALQALAERLGPYPFPSFHIAEVPRLQFSWGASSEQGFIMATSNFFAFGENLPLFAHEACHGWWGNLVHTEGPGSKLCGEALAQYGAVLAIEALEGPDAAALFLRESRPGYIDLQCARGYFTLWREGQDLVLSTMESEPASHNLADSKGMWIYHMLRQQVGDARFFATLRGLIEEYRGRAMRLDDVRQAFIAAAPELDLATFFRQWLDRVGAPVLEVDTADPGGPGRRTVTLAIHQIGELYDLPLQIELITSAGRSEHHVQLEQRVTTLVLAVTGELQEVRLDPRDQLLIWRPAYGPAPVLRQGRGR